MVNYGLALAMKNVSWSGLVGVEIGERRGLVSPLQLLRRLVGGFAWLIGVQVGIRLQCEQLLLARLLAECASALVSLRLVRYRRRCQVLHCRGK